MGSQNILQLATGGSFAVRQLYTDDEEILFEASRPILPNGIEEVVSRPDLGDRAIFLTLASIGEAQRHSESKLWREFEIMRPRILGALLDAMSYGLRAIGRVRCPPATRSGSQLANQHSGPPAPSRVRTRQTAGQRSTTSSKPIPWPVAFVQ